MYYETEHTSENSQWVLFIHGIGGSIQTWKYQIDDMVSRPPHLSRTSQGLCKNQQ